MELLGRLFDTSIYTTRANKNRAQIIYGACVLVLSLYTIFLIVDADTAWQSSFDVTRIILTYAVGIASIVMVRRGRLNLASFGPALMWYIGATLFVLRFNPLFTLVGLTGTGVILLSALLVGRRAIIVSTVLVLATLLVGRLRQDVTYLVDRGYTPLQDEVSITLLYLGIAGVALLFNRSLVTEREEVFESASVDRLRLAEITAQITQRIMSRTDLNEVLNTTVETIRREYEEIYHAQIFLIDPTQTRAELAASTGEVGQMLLANKHFLGVGSVSVIGQVTSKNQPVIARSGSSQTVHRRNEFLPDTAVEAAFPLRVGDTVIGALDLQSTNAEALREADTPIFQSLANTIAIAIDNARLFAETEQRLQENQRLVQQANNALQQVQQLNRQLTEQAWAEYLSGAPKNLSVTADFSNNSIVADEGWSATLRRAVASGEMVEERQDGTRFIALPLRVRGEVIGAMEFELDEDGNLAPEDVDLLKEVAERFGLAAENTRLYESSQRAAQRETIVNSINTRIQASNNVQAMLNEAAQGLKSTLRAEKVAIRLGKPPTATNGTHTKNGHAEGNDA